jgi:hypothetical protein
MDWPAFAQPGQVVRVDGEDHWGRIVTLHGCCGTADVEFAGAGDREPGTDLFTADQLVSVFARRENAVPRGYPLPGHARRGAVRPVRPAGSGRVPAGARL